MAANPVDSVSGGIVSSPTAVDIFVLVHLLCIHVLLFYLYRQASINFC